MIQTPETMRQKIDVFWGDFLVKHAVPFLNMFIAGILLDEGQCYQVRSVGKPLKRPFAREIGIGYKVTS